MRITALAPVLHSAIVVCASVFIGCANNSTSQQPVQKAQRAIVVAKKPIAKKAVTTEEITALAFSHDGSFLVVGRERKTGYDVRGIIEVWDAASRRKTRSWARDGHVSDLDVAPDNRTIVSGYSWGDDGQARLWDLNGRLLHTLKAPGEYNDPSVAFSPNGRYVVLAKIDVVKVWDTTGRFLREFRSVDHSKQPFANGIAISPDGKTVATATYDERASAVVYSFKTLKVRWEHKDREGGDIAYSPDGRYLANATVGGVLILRARNGRLVRTLGSTEDYHYISKVAFLPDGNTVVDDGGGELDYNGQGGNLRLWNFRSGKLLSTWPGAAPIAFSPDGKLLAFNGGNGKLLFHSLSPHK